MSKTYDASMKNACTYRLKHCFEQYCTAQLTHFTSFPLAACFSHPLREHGDSPVNCTSSVTESRVSHAACPHIGLSTSGIDPLCMLVMNAA